MSGGGDRPRTETRPFTPITGSSTVRGRRLAGVVLVTGARGFVGSHLVEALACEDVAQTIVAWQRPRPQLTPAFPTRPFGEVSSVERYPVDLLDRVGVERAIAELRPTAIFHCAGVANVLDSWSDTTSALEGNVSGTQYLLEAVAAAGLTSRILIPGSALIYKPSARAIREDDPIGPTSPYAVSKLAQELLGRRFAAAGLNILLTRSFTHLGPGQDLSYAASSFAHQIAQIEAGQVAPVIKVGPLDARRDLMDVRDTVRAYIALMAVVSGDTPYNVCSGHAHRIGDVLDGLLAQSRASVRVEVDPSRLRPTDYPLLLGDPTRIREAVGWQARIALPTTLQALLDYWRGVVRAD